jgi:hypothetical protein
MSQGPLPVAWSGIVAGAHGLWGQRLRDEMEKYNHQAGLKIVGEVLPDEANQVTLADETDEFGAGGTCDILLWRERFFRPSAASILR